AIRYVVFSAQRDRFNDFRWLARHAKVAANAIDGPWPQANAGEAKILEIDPCVAFVAALEHAVMRAGNQRAFVRNGTFRIALRCTEYGRGTRINQALNRLCCRAHRFEHCERADNVYGSA